MFSLLLLLLCCAGEADPYPDCTSLCDILVDACAYDAYPSYGSCMEACAYEVEEGGGENGVDVAGKLACMEAASCDTFAIIECEHAFGRAGE